MRVECEAARVECEAEMITLRARVRELEKSEAVAEFLGPIIEKAALRPTTTNHVNQSRNYLQYLLPSPLVSAPFRRKCQNLLRPSLSCGDRVASTR